MQNPAKLGFQLLAVLGFSIRHCFAHYLRQGCCMHESLSSAKAIGYSVLQGADVTPAAQYCHVRLCSYSFQPATYKGQV